MPEIGDKNFSKSGRPMVYTAQGWAYDNNVNVGKLTEFQGKNLAFASKLSEAERQYQEALAKGYDPTSISAMVNNISPVLDISGKRDINSLGESAKDNSIEAYARGQSGAAIGLGERLKFSAQHFPRFGQTLQNVEPNFRKYRENTYDSLRQTSGGAAAVLPLQLPKSTKFGVQATKQPSQPAKQSKYSPEQMQTVRKLGKIGGVGGSRTNPRMPVTEQEYNAIPRGQWIINHDGTLEQKAD